MTLRQARYNSTKADINLRKNKFSYLPVLTANTDVSRINGLTFDNVSGQLKWGIPFSSNSYMVGELVLFDGMFKLYELKRAKQQAQATRYTGQQTDIDLEAAVTGYFLQAMLDCEKYNTVTANLEYTEKAFESAKRKYDTDAVDFFSYMESLNNKNKAQAELLQSKCEYYFKQRILEFCQG